MGEERRSEGAGAVTPDGAPPGASSAASVARLATKFHRPPPPAATVPRRRLIQALREASTHKLTILSAPAGSGKSTLLRSWAAHDDPSRVAWVTLDEGDNDPAQFWSYVVEALRLVEPDVGTEALLSLATPGADVVEAVIPRLIDDAIRFSDPAVLVLDDYHVIADPAVHDQMTALLTHLPDGLRVVIGTRADPPLPLARLRSRGELTELRAGSLGFTEPEAAELLNDVMTLDLSPADVDRLWSRTEGWAAGLSLAGLSLQGHPDPPAFIDSFAGDDRHVLDYLVTEVLDRQPEDRQRFLLHTSVLARLCGPLCDAVTGTGGAAAVLDELERENLFLVPLDPGREWYRYQHLLAEVLRHELARREPNVVPLLHRRACLWYEAQGSIADAIGHAVAAGDVAPSAELIARHWKSFLNAGQVATVAGWLDALPEHRLRASASLCVARAATATTLGQPQAAARWLSAAEQLPEPGPPPDGGTSIESEVATLRALAFRLEGDLGNAVRQARRAVDLEPATSPWRALACAALGGSLYRLGEQAEARRWLQAALKAGASSADRQFSVVSALSDLALVACDGDEVDRAAELAHQALELARRHGLSEHSVVAAAHTALGRVFESNGDLDRAQHQLERGLELARRFRAPAQIASSLIALARIRAARSESGAADLLVEARRILFRCPDPGVVARLLTEAEDDLSRQRRPTRPSGDLTARERAVLLLLRSDLTQAEIAAELRLSPNTVKTHVRSLYAKLGVSSRAAAVTQARQLGLL